MRIRPSETRRAAVIQNRSTPHRHRLARALVALALALVVALPAAAYTIYLKDGSSINAEKKWEEIDGKAVITLPGGTRSTIALDEIDVERTLAANKDNLGTAQVIDGPTPSTEPTETRPDEPSLGDLIQQRQRSRDDAPKEPRQTRATAPSRVPTTSAGYPDLLSLERRPFRNIDLASELKDFFATQGLDQAQIFSGTVPGRPLVVVTTSSEASVFRSVAVAASALVNLRDRGQASDSLELLLLTPSRERAGQFLLTPELAQDLLSSRVDISTFYLQNVQF